MLALGFPVSSENFFQRQLRCANLLGKANSQFHNPRGRHNLARNTFNVYEMYDHMALHVGWRVGQTAA